MKQNTLRQNKHSYITMGCTSSAPSKQRKLPSGPPVGPSKIEIDQRIECGETVKATFGGVSVRYAYMSQRGYYPDDSSKPNQDSYTINPSFASRPSDILFGVFDGHGRDGDKCAHYVRDNLPSLLAKAVINSRKRQTSSIDSLENSGKEMIQDAIIKSHIECNKRMHASQELDSTLSGTTSISVYLHGDRNRITVSNVGDSRAVIGRKAEKDNAPNGTTKSGSSALKAFALSRDQTPYRRDERIRCRKAGARVLSLDQIEGLEPVDEEEELEDGAAEMVLGEEIDEGGDPPRIWSPNGDYPGTAFTRSIGDGIAEELGVTAEPEMLSRELTGEDKIIVLASDGVFEFLTNQSVVDICAKFSDPLEACRAVVAESYELWLQYELRTDDITMICIFIDDVNTSHVSSQVTSESPDLKSSAISTSSVDSIHIVDDELVTATCRPVRRNISLEKSRALEKMKTKYSSLKDVTDEPDDEIDLDKLQNEKTAEEKARISEAIRASVIFQNITDNQRDLIYDVMEPMHVKKGQWIIRQGTKGDRFYIVDDGSFEVRIVPEGHEDVNKDGGNVVHVYTGSRGKSHPSFGELALLHSAPRAASIIAQTDGSLWALHRAAFKKIVNGDKQYKRDGEKVLRKISNFNSFTEDDLKDLASYLCEAKYVSGDIIIKEGEPGDSIFIIRSGGVCECVQTGADGSQITTSLSGNDFFGTEVLEQGGTKEYACTVRAKGKVTCWILQKSDIKRVIGRRKK